VATIIVHGTMTTTPAHHLHWWWRSWGEEGFLRGITDGMTAVSGLEDIWKIDGVLVESIPELHPKWSFWTGGMGQFSQHDGYFMWVGGDSYAERDAGAHHLALYLSKIVEIAPEEPIRIIAHSHGCNVVKKATMLKELADTVFIESTVFLACPHFETHLIHDHEWYYPYCLNPSRVGKILNLYSKYDTVQTEIAEKLPSTLISTNWREWSPPKAHRIDQDPEVASLYENFEIATMDEGIAAHGAMHGITIGRLVGIWLESTDTFNDIVQTIQEKVGDEPLIVPVDDDGEGID